MNTKTASTVIAVVAVVSLIFTIYAWRQKNKCSCTKSVDDTTTGGSTEGNRMGMIL